MNRVIAPSALLALFSLAACAGHESATVQTVPPPPGESHQISVEIPLDGWQVDGHELLRVNELLDERTEFDANDFRLDELILIARSDDPAHAASAEVLVLEWRSGEFDIPQGGAEDWFEVRIPIGEEDPSGAWLLDVDGHVTIDLLVAVLEPPVEVVEERTVYRTRTIYRDVVDVHPRTYQAFWIYDPTRYYTVHYHAGVWPYRYFVGPWDYRYYDLAYRPYHLGYVHYHRYRDDHRRYRRGWRDDRRRSRFDEPPLRDFRDDRRARRMEALKRTHPRLRMFHRDDQGPLPPSAKPPRQETALERWERQKREHPRLRALHREEQTANTSQPALGNTDGRRPPVARERARPAQPRATTARSQPRPESDARDESAAPAAIAPRRTAIQPRQMPTLRRSTARTPAPNNARVRPVNRTAQRPAATATRPVPTLRRSTARSPAPAHTTVRPRTLERSSPSVARPQVRSRIDSGSRSAERRIAPTRVAPRQMPTVRSSARVQPQRRAITPSRSVSPRVQRQAPAPRSQPQRAPAPPRQTAPSRSSAPSNSRPADAPNSRTRVFER